MTEKKVVLQNTNMSVPPQKTGGKKKKTTHVPTKTRKTCAPKNQVTNAEISLALNLQKDLIVNHLKQKRARCQKLEVVLRKLSRVGWDGCGCGFGFGFLGRWRASCFRKGG
jgi:hypothetical protein